MIMCMHAHRDICQNAHCKAAAPCHPALNSLPGALATLLFLLAYWPGAPLTHAPSINALIGRSSKLTDAAGAEAASPLPHHTKPKLLKHLHVQPKKPDQQATKPLDAPAEKQQQQQQAPAAKPAAAAETPAAAPAKPDGSKVSLELFVMSLCPDASFCEHYFDKILQKLHPIVHVITE